MCPQVLPSYKSLYITFLSFSQSWFLRLLNFVKLIRICESSVQVILTVPKLEIMSSEIRVLFIHVADMYVFLLIGPSSPKVSSPLT
jgi:hypothetical protein